MCQDDKEESMEKSKVKFLNLNYVSVGPEIKKHGCMDAKQCRYIGIIHI